LPVCAGAPLRVSDFYLGCIHARHADLYLIGFARPIIGNIPSISEVQAAFVVGIIAGRVSRPPDTAARHERLEQERDRRFATLDRDVIYPVEMFPYCDFLARQMNQYPTIRTFNSIRGWWRAQLAPATTAPYWNHDQKVRSFFSSAPIFIPTLLVVLLLCLKPLDWTFRLVRWLGRRGSAVS
jgi:hypothetical protein